MIYSTVFCFCFFSNVHILLFLKYGWKTVRQLFPDHPFLTHFFWYSIVNWKLTNGQFINNYKSQYSLVGSFIGHSTPRKKVSSPRWPHSKLSISSICVQFQYCSTRNKMSFHWFWRCGMRQGWRGDAPSQHYLLKLSRGCFMWKNYMDNVKISRFLPYVLGSILSRVFYLFEPIFQYTSGIFIPLNAWTGGVGVCPDPFEGCSIVADS